MIVPDNHQPLSPPSTDVLDQNIIYSIYHYIKNKVMTVLHTLGLKINHITDTNKASTPSTTVQGRSANNTSSLLAITIKDEYSQTVVLNKSSQPLLTLYTAETNSYSTIYHIYSYIKNTLINTLHI